MDAQTNDASGNRNEDQNVREFVDLLSVERIDADLFEGRRLSVKIGRVFGGQVVAQALSATEGTVEDDRIPHSMHAYFMRPGDENEPILYRVERERDGRSFSTRRVVAEQHGKPILSASINFQVPEEGVSHQIEMPDVPPPEDVAPIPRGSFPRPIEMRPIFGFGDVRGGEKGDPAMQLWFKPTAPLPDDAALHRWVLAHTSDSNLLGPAMRPHGVSWQTPGYQTTSLDHSLWFHHDFRVDDWLLYVAESPWSGSARGLSFGRFFTRDGKLIASAAQEGLIRQVGQKG